MDMSTLIPRDSQEINFILLKSKGCKYASGWCKEESVIFRGVRLLLYVSIGFIGNPMAGEKSANPRWAEGWFMQFIPVTRQNGRRAG
jgi:hypothetical protein